MNLANRESPGGPMKSTEGNEGNKVLTGETMRLCEQFKPLFPAFLRLN
jgi:hypothetical protein